MHTHIISMANPVFRIVKELIMLPIIVPNTVVPQHILHVTSRYHTAIHRWRERRTKMPSSKNVIPNLVKLMRQMQML